MSRVADYTAIAANYGVSAEIDPSDHIFRFLREHPNVGERAATDYFSDGRECAIKLRTLIQEQRPVSSVRILEFASGYGRVTRHLPKVIPEATLTACDIHAEAVRFIARLGVEAIISSENPDNFNPGRSFDVVFALSFFSHIPQTTWTRWLRRLLDYTLPGGLLIFTTHGERSRKFIAPESVPSDDFVFLPHSEQLDLPSEQYGTTLSPFAFVNRQITALGDARLIKFQEGHWWLHQDLYVLERATRKVLETKEADVAGRATELARVKADLAAHVAELARLRGALTAERNRGATLEAHLDAVERSTSWRITRPLRAAKAWIRRRASDRRPPL